MIFNLTKNQAQVLSLLFTHPQELYLRQIAKLLGKQPGVFQRDINKLEEKGIVNSHYLGHLRFFSINKDHPLYKEIKSIISKTTGAEIIIKETIYSHPKIKCAFIYGSFAKNEQDRQSDLDLMIIGRPDQDKLVQEIRQLEKKFGREINYVIFSEKEFKQKKNDPFIKDVIESEKIILKQNEKYFKI